MFEIISRADLIVFFLHFFSFFDGLKREKNEHLRWESRVFNGFLQLEKRLNDLGNDGATEIFISKSKKWVVEVILTDLNFCG